MIRINIDKLVIKRVVIFVFFSLYFSSAFSDSETIKQFIDQWRQKNQIPAVSFLIKGSKYNIYYLSGTTTLNGNKK